MRTFRCLVWTGWAAILIAGCGSLDMAPNLGGTAPVAPAAVVGLEGAVFLPPIGPPIDTTGFFAQADLRIEVWSLELQAGAYVPNALLSTLPTEVGDRYYQASWQVRATAIAHPEVSVVRVVAVADGLAGSTLERPCRGKRACVVASFDAVIKRTRTNRALRDLAPVDLTDTQTLPVKVWLQAASRRPTTLGELVRLSDGLPFENPVGNCVVNEFNLPGQGLNALGAGLNALGAVGGVFVRPPGGLTLPPPEDYEVRLLTAEEAGAWAAGLANGGDAWSGAVLIVDDFHGVYTLGPELWPEFDGFVGTPEETDDYLWSLIDGGSLSHGALVLHQTLRMVEAAGFAPVAVPSPDFHVFARDGVFPYLVVAAVDIGGTNLDSAAVGARIGHALDALTYLSGSDGDVFDVRDVAVNMSFVIVPCSVLDDYERAVERIEGLTTFEDYVAALGAENSVAFDFYDELKALLLRIESAADDPLYAQVKACEGAAPEPRVPVVLPLDFALALKVDPLDRSGGFVRYVSPLDPAFWVEVRVRDDTAGFGEVIDWRSSRPLGQVEVKGGRGSLTYAYTGGATSDEGVHAPLAPNGAVYHDGSHVVFVPTAPTPLGFIAAGSWAGTPWTDLVADGAPTPFGCGGARLNYVASSGNFGLPYAMYPAAWPEVVAVSAQYAVPTASYDPRTSGFANAGEILAPGALYELSRTSDDTQVVSYAGTSFSAPVVALFTALDLMRDVPACGTPTYSRLTEEPDDGAVPLSAGGCVLP